jgi:hypothetical protein
LLPNVFYALQVPRVSSRLRKLPFAALCMLLLWAAMCCRVSQQAGGVGSNMSVTTSSSSSIAAMQVPGAYIAGLSSKTTGTLSSMTVAAVPILLALFLVQVRGQTAKLSMQTGFHSPLCLPEISHGNKSCHLRTQAWHPLHFACLAC